MHEAFRHLAKRVDQAREALNEVVREVEQQLEREQRTLEELEFGDEFDADGSTVQEEVVATLQEVVEQLSGAEERLLHAERSLRDLPLRG